MWHEVIEAGGSSQRANSMHTLILNSETANLSIEYLLKQVDSGGVEVRDAQGRVVALVLSPMDHQAWAYAEANLDLDQRRDELKQAMARSGGVTTAQLLQNAAAATQPDSPR
jgi:hypothetical protein